MAEIIQLISIMALPFLLAVTLHEAGHAYSAHYLGDATQRGSGRLSLNPLVHVDPVGTVVIPLAAIILQLPFLIGYAKPVMIQPRYFKKYKRDMILVALAGPAGNLIVAIFCAYILRFSISFGANENDWIFQTMQMGVFLNCLFMVFNLLPIPPLDGSAVVEQYLPNDLAQTYRSIAPYGFFILMAVIFLAIEIVYVPTLFFFNLILSLVGL